MKRVVLIWKSGGDFTLQDVELISKRINNYASEKVEVLCFYDRVKEPVFLKFCTLMPMVVDYPGWWAKMNLYHPLLEKYRPYLYLDLDTAVLKDIIPAFTVFENKKGLGFLEDLWWGGVLATGMIYFQQCEKINTIWNEWKKNPQGIMKKYARGGDQKFVGSVVDADYYLQKAVNGIRDAKPFRKPLLSNPGEDAVFVCFHGEPRIRKSPLNWVKQYVKGVTVKESWVINLDNRMDRLADFRKQNLPFVFNRFPAMTGKEGIDGCNASHLEILKKKHCFPFIIFEDDCHLTIPWSDIELYMKQLPDDWDMLYLGGNMQAPAQKVSGNLLKIRKTLTTHAIIYNTQRVVDYIIENMEKHSHIDVFYANEVQEKFNCYMVSPLAAVQRPSFSDVRKGTRDYSKELKTNFEKYGT